MNDVTYIASPHQDERPEGAVVDLLILHAISLPAGCFSTASIIALFCGDLLHTEDPSLSALRGLRVSAHYMIDRQGRMIQFVADHRRAWHAGLSVWQGAERCNDFSIGIEIIGDERSPFTVQQYHSAARLSRQLLDRHPMITAERIVGHADVAPGRKWDPGKQWNWSRFHQILDCNLPNLQEHR
ncbi:MAG: 1,6-anhydro-N-acetylmuramyl-L-alanine amidase AmpD [Mariprofundaceae bacterium]|nr:1,6-anhydro-N-acetylmuramyl-L-alanine amidase AmpD [Mariprofundaceae bacterium]